MNALRLATCLVALAAVSGAHAQSAATLGRPAGPTRQVDNKVPQPGETGKIGEEKSTLQPAGKKTITVISNVTRPTLTVFRPAKEKDTGAAVVICPGGGYNILAWDLEGTEIAEWLNSVGVTAAVLKYRVPRRDGDSDNKLPLMDAQRAMSLLRSKAS